MIIDDHDPKPRWSRLARTRSTEEPAEPFFRDPDDQPLPVVGELDERFLSAGYLRSRVSLRGASQLVPLRPLTNLLFRLRAVFGLGPRVEVLAYLLTHPGSQSAEIARATKYSRTQVQEALSSLAQADIAVVKPRGRRRTYSVDAGRWLALLDIPGEPPRWIDWCRVFGALSKLTAFLRSIEQQPPSDYLLQSDILGLSTALSQELADTGLANPFERQLGLAESAEVFEARVRSLLDELTGREAGPRPPTPSGPAHRPRRR
jgi:DNA-binding transcriptional ArsR family regulator